MSRWKLRSDVRFRLVGDEAVVIRQEEGEVLVVNPVGARILQLVEAGVEREQMVGALEGEFDVAVDLLDADVDRFLAEMTESGVLESESGS